MVNLELAQKIVDTLNEAVELDRPAVAAMIKNRVPCNEELADHPTIQIARRDGGHTLSVLGFLNGLCGTYDDGPKKGFGAVAAVFEDNYEYLAGYLSHFVVLENAEDDE